MSFPPLINVTITIYNSSFSDESSKETLPTTLRFKLAINLLTNICYGFRSWIMVFHSVMRYELVIVLKNNLSTLETPVFQSNEKLLDGHYVPRSPNFLLTWCTA